MKTPRINDFYPDAKVPGLKSPMDNMPAIENGNVAISKALNRKNKPQPASVAINNGKAALPSRRPFLRRTFDFYEDQINFLKRESLQEKLAGKERGMNEMVREAIDEWIEKRLSGK